MTTLDLHAPAAVVPVLDVVDGQGAWITRVDPDAPGSRGAHSDRQHRIAWVSDGEVRASVGGRCWLLPTTRAIWIPSGTACELRAGRRTVLHCLSVATTECLIDWREPVVLAITPMLRELLLNLSGSDPRQPISVAAATLLFSLVKPLSQTALQLPLPTDYRAVALAQAVLARPADARTLDEWADRFDTSASTLRRAFVDETGLTFDEWQTQSRLRASLSLLARDVPVESVAGQVGYGSTEEFVDAFRAHFGHTPGRHAKRVRAGSARSG